MNEGIEFISNLMKWVITVVMSSSIPSFNWLHSNNINSGSETEREELIDCLFAAAPFQSLNEIQN